MIQLAAELETMPVEELEEQVVFGEWRGLRHTSSRSLARTRQLMDLLGYDPAVPRHPVIGVVGSKGKGTASAYASAALAGLGWQVGTVMSPGAVSNADRIRLDGVALDDAHRRRVLLRLADGIRRLPSPTAESGYLAPTGLFLLMGFLVFEEESVDVVVAEAGLGGASDDLSHWPLNAVVVTGIFGEHLEILGPTVADVARDKAGVITETSRFVVSAEQSPEVQAAVQARLGEVFAAAGRHQGQLLGPSAEAMAIAGHLPSGHARTNAALGITAALQLNALITAPKHAPVISRDDGDSAEKREIRGAIATAEENRSGAGPELDQAPHSVHQAVRSVNYPGRLSIHPVAGGTHCVVDSAVSREGVAMARQHARHLLGAVEQVLVCLPPSKDLAGFIAELEGFTGRKVFVEIPGAYTGMPQRSDWPWEWVTEDQLPELLGEANALAVGTVLFTSLVLRTLGVRADLLFTVPRTAEERTAEE